MAFMMWRSHIYSTQAITTDWRRYLCSQSRFQSGRRNERIDGLIVMAGLEHDFLLLSTREHPYTDYMKWINHRNAIRIDDDIMHYMQDTLNWITCYNPAQKMRKHKGLNSYGPTVIKEDGAVDAEKLFTTWADLFSIVIT